MCCFISYLLFFQLLLDIILKKQNLSYFFKLFEKKNPSNIEKKFKIIKNNELPQY